ncbi:TRAP transporter fused permease subunit [Oceanicola sp. 22II-s10i]|uniref:TRAP transporter permease n=1 Tax=Oceanicola sp. 22II-s10i TaxID=1317116 RepID=UPI0015962A83|nr:TRAP transporter fused permease subunit [Oceanicola sp. 22II-s10i]
MQSFRFWIVSILAVGISLQAIYVALFGMLEAGPHRGFVFGAAILVVLLGAGVRRDEPLPAWRNVLDAALIAVIGLGLWEFLNLYEAFENMLMGLSKTQQWIGLGATLVVIEATRRVFGLSLAIVTLLMLGYVLFGENLPGIFAHSGFSLSRSMETIWFGFQGVFGMPLAVTLQIILIFIVFGSALESTGASNALIRISLYYTGKFKGGPALAAVVASALFGSMSGSVTANVVGTGSFTIPLIKRRGFKPHFAGAVEATASTGGQIVPPVMGAAAFLMADLTGMNYLSICVAALLPALFYYGALAAAIIVEARRAGVEATPESELVPLDRSDWLSALMFVVPIFVVVAVLVSGRSPAMSGVLGTLSAVAMGLIVNPEFRRAPQKILSMLADAGRSGGAIIVAVGAIGVILAVMSITGVGIRFASVVSTLGEGNLFLSLVVAAMACIILGMGMPTLPAYLIIVLVLGPAIKRLGIDDLSVHMFVFYYGVLSAITPPIALAAFAAAPIAKANPMMIGVTSLKLSFVGFMIPFAIIYYPELLIVNGFEWFDLISIVARMSLAVWMASTGLIGFSKSQIGMPMRILRVAIAVLLIYPVVWVEAAAAATALALTLFDRFTVRTHAHG